MRDQRNMRSTARWLAALAVMAVGVATSAAPAHAAGELTRERLALVRVAPGPASFQLDADVTLEGRRAFAGAIAARYNNGRIADVSPVSHTSFGGSEAPGVYAPEGSVTTCSAGICAVQETWGGGFSVIGADDGGAGAYNVVLVVIEGARIDYRFRGDGWVVRRADFAYRYVDGTEAEAVSAGDGSRKAELFLEAAAQGGPGGSLAQALPPCSTQGAGVAHRGVGRMTLDGGTAPVTVTCPQVGGATAISAFAPAATNWRAHGAVVGDTALRETRLFVIDAPAADPTRTDDSGDVRPPVGPPAPPPPPPGPHTPDADAGDPDPARDAVAAPPPAADRTPCRPSVRTTRSRRGLRVRTTATEDCELRLRLVVRGKVLARGALRARPGRISAVSLRAPRRGRLRLVIDSVDEAGNRTSRTIAVA